MAYQKCILSQTNTTNARADVYQGWVIVVGVKAITRSFGYRVSFVTQVNGIDIWIVESGGDNDI